MNENFSQTPYSSIQEIQSRKALLRKEIQQDSLKIENQWRSLFQKPVALKANATPAQRIASILSTGTGVLDAFLLGYKYCSGRCLLQPSPYTMGYTQAHYAVTLRRFQPNA